MSRRRLQKTLADYLVVGVSPVLIMLLVGSLVFFLIEIFYRGDLAAGVRWVMFWFVIAIVLVSRIGIEQGTGQATVYGLGLAAATWLYLVRTHPAYLVGMVLLAMVWWCANKLTRDCTVIDDDEDASGRGLVEVSTERHVERLTADKPRELAGDKAPPRGPTTSRSTVSSASALRTAHNRQARKRSVAPHPPGLWVVYFSLAALPLFGIGQVLLPGDDTGSRRIGFALLVVYLIAALGLLLTTSFLGLRRYLRQRHITMPGTVAFGWVRFGVGVAVAVLALALLLPRPGADYTWKTLAYRIDYQLRRASEYAMRLNPPGQGPGRAGEHGKRAGDQDAAGLKNGPQPGANQSAGTDQAPSQRQSQTGPKPAPSPKQSSPVPDQPAPPYILLRRLLVFAAIVLVVVWLVRHWRLIVEILRSLVLALAEFFRNCRGLGETPKREREAGLKKTGARLHPFSTYKNPFVTGKDRVWPPERLIAYSFEALQAWAQEQGVQLRLEQTPREFCRALGEQFPEVAAGASRLSYLYAHAAYGRKLPDPCDFEPVRVLWRHLASSVAVRASPRDRPEFAGAN